MRGIPMYSESIISSGGKVWIDSEAYIHYMANRNKFLQGEKVRKYRRKIA